MPARTLRAPGTLLPVTLFVGVLLAYVSFSPGSIRWMGYAQEDTRAAERMAGNLSNWLRLRPAAAPIIPTRHGILEVIVKQPFALTALWLRSSSPRLSDGVEALEPILETALIVVLVFVWLRRLCASERWAWVLAMGAGFSTFLWPYAYMGMETTQSLAVLVAGYLALAPPAPRGWRRTIVLSLASACAVSVKSTGFLLLPAVGFLGYQYFRTNWDIGKARRRAQAAFFVVTVLATRAATWYCVVAYFAGGSHVTTHVEGQLATDPLAVPFSFVSYLFSANKGLLVFAPLALLALARFRHVDEEGRPALLFALATLGGLALGFSMLSTWTDETWGPRYLHSAIAPLVIALGASRRREVPALRREWAVILSLAVGGGVNFLGCAIHYGALHTAMVEASQHTLEGAQSDPVWNHVRFNARVFGVWLARLGGTDGARVWTPAHRWWLRDAPQGWSWKPVDLAPLARPQPLVLRLWQEGTTIPLRALWLALLVTAVLGLAILGWTARVVWRADRASS
ncbi:MAG: hypothetical protein ABR961_09075 [Thermoanaerobaculaceae bacterium]|jgi:hypothetical protein